MAIYEQFSMEITDPETTNIDPSIRDRIERNRNSLTIYGCTGVQEKDNTYAHQSYASIYSHYAGEHAHPAVVDAIEAAYPPLTIIEMEVDKTSIKE